MLAFCADTKVTGWHDVRCSAACVARSRCIILLCIPREPFGKHAESPSPLEHRDLSEYAQELADVLGM
jgi:hypothetical protein